eukprot:scaffold1453_cov112-Isochrysis_galbana.AAC.12
MPNRCTTSVMSERRAARPGGGVASASPMHSVGQRFDERHRLLPVRTGCRAEARLNKATTRSVLLRVGRPQGAAASLPCSLRDASKGALWRGDGDGPTAGAPVGRAEPPRRPPRVQASRLLRHKLAKGRLLLEHNDQPFIQHCANGRLLAEGAPDEAEELQLELERDGGRRAAGTRRGARGVGRAVQEHQEAVHSGEP